MKSASFAGSSEGESVVDSDEAADSEDYSEEDEDEEEGLSWDELEEEAKRSMFTWILITDISLWAGLRYFSMNFSSLLSISEKRSSETQTSINPNSILLMEQGRHSNHQEEFVITSKAQRQRDTNGGCFLL